LRDLLNSQVIPTVTLTDLFRQARGSDIILAAHAVNQGKVPEIDNVANHDLFFVRADEEVTVLTAILRLVTERIPERFGLNPVDDVQVLSPMHDGPAGVAALNRELQIALNPPRSGVPELSRVERTFRLGDKVMQIRNDYDRDVYNGDVGKVVAVHSEEQRLVAAFPTGTGTLAVEYEALDLDELVLAYATSVHKAQGSEYPCIVMPLLTRHYILLQRNLLYTAITRARQLCVLVGSPKALAVAVDRDQRERRNTRLAHRIREPQVDLIQLELV
jgi:exodeoxyribonuclease V alpha subunit